MIQPPELSIVVPVYNEPDNIGPALAQIAEHVRTLHEILVVYDFDEDTTVPVVRDLQPSMPTVRLLRNDLGRGVLNALRAGFADARAPLILVSMADGSDEMTIVDDMVELARDGADLVAASRYMRGGRQVGGPRLKGMLSRAAGLSLHWFARVPIHDPTNNFKLYRRELLDSIEIESAGGFELALEITVKAWRDRRPMAEMPTTWRDRTAGESRFRMREWLPKYLRWYVAAFGRSSAREVAA